ncbi:MAG: S41 family peptidase [Candidatus Aminicenantes bacterium]
MRLLKHAIMMSLLVFFSLLPVCADKNETGLAIKNIEAFARLYGYVKYFYPGDEAANTDWDRFAVCGVKQVETARDRAELKKTLEELFLPIAPALLIHESHQKTNFSIATITPPDTKNMKVVAWQHLGVGFGNPRDIYRSIRINKPDILFFKNSYGAIANGLDAIPYRGKTIKLKAAVKVGKGMGQLWLRVDRTGKEVGFFDDMDEKPIQSNQWNYYEISGPVAKDAEKVYYGCLLREAGQLWVDDFQLYIKAEGEENQDQWVPIIIKNPGFEEDKEGSAPKGWIAQSDRYGFTVTAETAVKGSRSVTITSSALPLCQPLFAEKPRIGETIAKELGCGLSCVMPIALYGTETHTFPQPAAKELKRLETAIKKELSQERDSKADPRIKRLAGIVITWNVLQHFYPYFHDSKTDWNAALTEALTSAYQDNSQLDFLETLNKMMAHLKDGQAGAYLPGNTARMYLPPINWDWIHGQLVITDVYDNNLEALHAGDVIVEVGELKANEALEIKERTISAATKGWLRFRAREELLRGKEKSKIHLKIKRDKPNIFYNETVSRSAFSPKYYGYVEKQKKQSGEIEPGIYYLNLDLTPMPEINRLMPELQKVKSIICDLRGSPKGSHLLIGHLVKEKITSQEMWVPQVIYPDYEKVTYKKMKWQVEPLEPFLTAKMIFIADSRTIDYGESILSFVRQYKLGTIVGQPTAGTTGSTNSFYLFGKYLIRWTGMKVVNHDGSPHHGVGIIPHVPVERTLKGVKEGRDELLEKAIEIAKQ